MWAFLRSLAILLGPCTLSLATPTNVGSRDVIARAGSVYNLPGDPAYTVSEADLQAAINCPNGNTKPKTVLLVPGTGSPTVDFYKTNYGSLLPANGFSVCYLVVPGYSTFDAQVTSEYVAYGVNSLAQSTGTPIRVLTHSQGGLNMQWALTFFPSMRANTFAFTALAPDYHGTTGVQPNTTLLQLPQSGGVAAVLQQSANSNYVQALARHGGLEAHVPTSNIYTLTDNIVHPESGPNATSVLSGAQAVNVPIQTICPLRQDDHFQVVIDVISGLLVLQAFSSPSGKADPSLITSPQRDSLCAKTPQQFTGADSIPLFTVSSLIALFLTGVGFPGSYVSVEPPLMAYAQ